MHEFVILADDFTGANDTGVQVAKRGLPVSVILRAEDIRPGSESMVIDSESRVISETDAYNRVYAMASAVEQTGGCRFLYKKVDSTLRGNITAEIKGAKGTFRHDNLKSKQSLPPAIPTSSSLPHHCLHRGGLYRTAVSMFTAFL